MTSKNVLKLATRKNPEPDANIIEALENVLSQAKSGEITSLAMCYDKLSSEVVTVLELSGNRFEMSHAISALWFRFQQRMLDEVETDE